MGSALGATTLDLGLVLGAFLAGAGIFQIPAGMAALRWGNRNVALASLALMGVFCLASAFSPNWIVLALLRFGAGAGAAFFFAPALGLVASYYPSGSARAYRGPLQLRLQSRFGGRSVFGRADRGRVWMGVGARSGRIGAARFLRRRPVLPPPGGPGPRSAGPGRPLERQPTGAPLAGPVGTRPIVHRALERILRRGPGTLSNTPTRPTPAGAWRSPRVSRRS